MSPMSPSMSPIFPHVPMSYIPLCLLLCPFLYPLLCPSVSTTMSPSMSPPISLHVHSYDPISLLCPPFPLCHSYVSLYPSYVLPTFPMPLLCPPCSPYELADSKLSSNLCKSIKSIVELKVKFPLLI